MQFILFLALVGSNGAGNNSLDNVVFYSPETCETAKGLWLQQFADVTQVRASAFCAPRMVSPYGSITLDKQP